MASLPLGCARLRVAGRLAAELRRIGLMSASRVIAAKELTSHRIRHNSSDLLLDSKDVSQDAVEGPRAEAIAGSYDNQLYCYAHVLAERRTPPSIRYFR